MAAWLVFNYREGGGLKEISHLAGRGNRLYQPGRAIHEPDPRHAEFSMLDGDAAGFAEQLLLIADAHDRRVDSAEHGVNAGQSLDPLLFLDVIERECNVARQFVEDLHFLFVEEAGLARMQAEAAHCPCRHDQGQDCNRANAPLIEPLLVPDTRVALRVAHDQRPHLSHRYGADAMAFGRFIAQRKIALDHFQKPFVSPRRGDRLQAHLFLIHDAQPGKSKTSRIDRNATGLLEQLAAIPDARDDPVNTTEHRVHAG